MFPTPPEHSGWVPVGCKRGGEAGTLDRRVRDPVLGLRATSLFICILWCQGHASAETGCSPKALDGLAGQRCRQPNLRTDFPIVLWTSCFPALCPEGLWSGVCAGLPLSISIEIGSGSWEEKSPWESYTQPCGVCPHMHFSPQSRHWRFVIHRAELR